MGTSRLDIRTEKGFNKARRQHKPKSPIDKAKGYEVIWNQVAPVFEVGRLYANPCFVYVIGEPDNGPLKIGKSTDPIARLRGMQTGNPRRLRIEYVLLGDIVIEKLLHELWEPFAVISSRSIGKPDAAPGTEWFKPEARGELLPIINDAAERQVEYVYSAMATQAATHDFADLERIVRDAHADSGFVARGRDEVRLLAQGAGHVIANRESRI